MNCWHIPARGQRTVESLHVQRIVGTGRIHNINVTCKALNGMVDL